MVRGLSLSAGPNDPDDGRLLQKRKSGVGNLGARSGMQCMSRVLLRLIPADRRIVISVRAPVPIVCRRLLDRSSQNGRGTTRPGARRAAAARIGGRLEERRAGEPRARLLGGRERRVGSGSRATAVDVGSNGDSSYSGLAVRAAERAAVDARGVAWTGGGCGRAPRARRCSMRRRSLRGVPPMLPLPPWRVGVCGGLRDGPVRRGLQAGGEEGRVEHAPRWGCVVRRGEGGLMRNCSGGRAWATGCARSGAEPWIFFAPELGDGADADALEVVPRLARVALYELAAVVLAAAHAHDFVVRVVVAAAAARRALLLAVRERAHATLGEESRARVGGGRSGTRGRRDIRCVWSE